MYLRTCHETIHYIKGQIVIIEALIQTALILRNLYPNIQAGYVHLSAKIVPAGRQTKQSEIINNYN